MPMSYDRSCEVLATLTHALEYLETVQDSLGRRTPDDCILIENAIHAVRDEFHDAPENAGIPLPAYPICYSLTRGLHPDFARTLLRSSY